MYPDQSEPRHTPKRQNSLATMSKAVGQQSHQLSICRGVELQGFKHLQVCKIQNNEMQQAYVTL